MWSIDDVKDVVSEIQGDLFHKACDQTLAMPALIRAELERRLEAEFESYPKDYLVYVELPGLDPRQLGAEVLVLSDQISLINTRAPLQYVERLVRPSLVADVDHLLKDVESMDEAFEALRPINSCLLKQDSVYLRISESGALPSFTSEQEPAFLSRTLATVKIFLLYGLEIGLLDRRNIFRYKHNDPGPRTIVHAAIHAINSEEKQTVEIPRDFENFLCGLTFSNSYEENTERFQCNGFERELRPVSRFLSILPVDAYARRIAAGIEWLLDSLLATNQTTSLLQSCIGIEAILGDENPVAYESGITARLSERFAYLMGTSIHNRRELRDQFRTIFAKRGDLVHARRHRLPPHDLKIVQAAQRMLQELIRKELTLFLDLPITTLSKMNTVDIKSNLKPF